MCKKLPQISETYGFNRQLEKSLEKALQNQEIQITNKHGKMLTHISHQATKIKIM